MSEHDSTSILVLGYGNPRRSDDGVGCLVARTLSWFVKNNWLVGGIKPPVCLEVSGEALTLMDKWIEFQNVLLIDAVRSGAPPGTIHRIDVHRQTLPRSLFLASSHAFGLAETIELARALNRLPPGLVIYGIEGRNYTAGTSLSPEVRQAANEVILRIQAEMNWHDKANAFGKRNHPLTVKA